MPATIPSASPKAFRRAADQLMRALARRGVEISHPAALDALSAAHEVADWNTMSALLKAAAAPAAATAAASRPEGPAPVPGELFAGPVTADGWADFQRWAGARRASFGTLYLRPGHPIRAEDGRPVTAAATGGADLVGILRTTYGDNAPAQVRAGDMLDYVSEVTADPLVPGRAKSRAHMTAFRTNDGVQVEMKPLPGMPPAFEALGLPLRVLHALGRGGGLNLFCGPDEGRDAMIAGLIRARCEMPDARERVVDYARPFPYVYDGLSFPASFVTQMEMPDGMPVRDRLQAAAKRRATIVFPGIVRTPDDAMYCAAAAEQGVTVIVSVPSADLMDGFARFRKISDSEMAASLNLIAAPPAFDGGPAQCAILDGGLRERLVRCTDRRQRQREPMEDVIRDAMEASAA